jgi:hypothetical protein
MGAAVPVSQIIAALGLPYRRPATANNETFGRRGFPLPHPRFLLRSVCLADGMLPRATRRLAGGGFRPQPPAFRSARLALQVAPYRGQRGAWQIGAPAPTAPLSAALGLSRRRLAIAGIKMVGRYGLSCRRLATAGSEALGRWGLPPPHPAFRCARLVL